MADIVLVTGATSFIGSHVINILLQEGWKVRATVRSLTSDKTKALQECFQQYQQQLELVEADLKNPDDWPPVIKGCTYLHHIAAPVEPEAFAADPGNKRLKAPAEVAKVVGMVVDSTKFIVEMAIAAGVKRFINTSSCAAMIPAGWAECLYPHPDIPAASVTTLDPSAVFKEETWTDERLVDGYLLAKTRAEKAAWEAAKGSPMELVCVNPGYTTGPQLHKLISAPSLALVDNIMSQPPGTGVSVCGVSFFPSFKFGCGDVRDVARVHVNAMTSPKAAGNRYLTATAVIDTWEIMDILAEEFRPMGYDVTTTKLPKCVMGLAAFCDPSAKRIYKNWGRYPKLDSQKVRRDFELELTDLRTSVIETVLASVATGRYERRPGFKSDMPQYQNAGNFIHLKA